MDGTRKWISYSMWNKLAFTGVFIALLFTEASQAGGTLPPLPDTSLGIHSFLTFDSLVAPANATSVYSKYDFVWGSSRNVPAAHAANPGIIISYYIPFMRDPDASHNLAWWQNFHPDWVLYLCDRKTPSYQYGDANVPLDFTNPDVIAWQVATYALPVSQKGYNAIAADNLVERNGEGACGIFRNGQWVQLFNGTTVDDAYTNGVINWLKGFQTGLRALANPLLLIPNYWGGPPSDPIVQQIVSNLDATLDEAGFGSDYGGRIGGKRWWNKVALMENMQAQKKGYYAISQFTSPTPTATATPTVDDIQYAIASYLMGKEQAAGIFLSGVQQYGSDLWHSEYTAAIGLPCALMTVDQGVYIRRYASGLAVVNVLPWSSKDYVLPAGIQWTDISTGAAVGPSVTLGPTSGRVFVAPADPVSICPVK